MFGVNIEIPLFREQPVIKIYTAAIQQMINKYFFIRNKYFFIRT